MPPLRAIEMAIADSVTVSMAAEIKGMLRRMEGVRKVSTVTLSGVISEYAGNRRTSSKVRPLRMDMLMAQNSRKVRWRALSHYRSPFCKLAQEACQGGGRPGASLFEALPERAALACFADSLSLYSTPSCRNNPRKAGQIRKDCGSAPGCGLEHGEKGVSLRHAHFHEQ